MNKIPRTIFIFLVASLLISGCSAPRSAKHTLDDFGFLQRGAAYDQVVQKLGDPQGQSDASAPFVTYTYDLKDGSKVYLGFLKQADYLDTAYYYQGKEMKSIVTASANLPSGVVRQLTLDDFQALKAGAKYFDDVYSHFGPPNDFAVFEGGALSIIYYLKDGGRIALNSDYGWDCFKRVGYSPDSSGGNWQVLSEDTQGLCGGK